jgi:hydroxymethylglutaryl-CoA lyase
VTLADTTGMATPRIIEAVLGSTGVDVGLHLHDTRGTGLLNLFFALQCGVRRFDTSVGGLGGSPFAEGSGGNVATEDAVALLDDLGIETGVNLNALIEVSHRLEALIGRPVPSRIAHVGPRTPAARA